MILALQRLQGWPLAAALAVLALLCLTWARASWWRLLRRLRYMLVVLAVLFAWQTPGALLWPALGAWSPSADGCRLAFDNAARILVVVSVVALMLRALTHAQWVQGIYGLLAPACHFGFPAERLALRLQLVLQDAELADRTAWREALAPRLDVPGDAPALRLFPMQSWDVLAVVLLCLALWGLW